MLLCMIRKSSACRGVPDNGCAVWRCVISRFMANVCKYAVYTLDHVTRIVSGCYRGESPGQ